MSKLATNISDKKYKIEDALLLLKNNSPRKFLESVEISVRFTVLPKKNFILKGYSVLPNAIGKNYRIAFFSEHDIMIDGCIKLDQNTLFKLTKKSLSFDILLVTPVTVVKIGKLNKMLNGKKLMPDVKYGTITTDLDAMVDKIRKNYVTFKSDKNFAFNLLVGKLDLSVSELIENIEVLLSDIKKQRPINCKSIYVKSLFVSTTMGPGINIDIDSLNC